MSDAKPISESSVDQDNLYREEVVTDLRAATLRRLIPLKVDGSEDPGRPTLYLGETQLMTQAGVVPISAPIEAASLQEAIEQFPDAINRAIERVIEEAREMQRQEASRIVVPQAGFAPPGGPTGPGGKIIL